MEENASVTCWVDFGNNRKYYIMLAVFNACMAVWTTFSNVLVLASIWKTPSLHTPSNVLLFGLALSDFGVGCLAQPLFVLSSAAQLQNKCTLFDLSTDVFNATATLLSAISFASVAFVGVDRLLALYLHLRYNSVVTVQRVIIVLIGLWVTGILTVLLYFWSEFVFQVVMLIGASVFLLASAVIYFKIYKVCRQHHISVKAQEDATIAFHHSHGRRQHKHAISVMYVYCLMLLCYLPFTFCLVVLLITGLNSLKQLVFEFTLTVLFFNSLLNPLVYCWRVCGIRTAMKRIIFSSCHH